MAGYGGSEKATKVLSPEGHCFILDIRKGERVGFQLMPEPISESKSAIYNEIPIIGRSLPLMGYAGSTSRMIGLSLNFAALNRPGQGTWDTLFVQDRVRFLEAKVYPRYLDGFTFPPPLLWLQIGKAIGMQCVMTSVSTSWFGPWDPGNIEYEDAVDFASPFRATVDCQFQEYGENDDDARHPQDHDLARDGRNQYYAGAISVEGGKYTDIPIAVPES